MRMIEGILREIRDNRTFLITTHENPDGDAVGSSLALASYLKKLGKEVTVYFCDPVPDLYTFLPLTDTVVHELPATDSDVCFVLDVGEFRRAGEAFNGYSRVRKFINLDHHATSEQFGAINLIDVEAAATAAIVYRLIKAAGVEIDYDIALCIYTAVITDTGSFRYSNSNPEAFLIASEMIATGVNAWYISERLFESQPRQRLELLALSLATLDISPSGTFASVVVTLDMYDKTGANAEMTDGFVNYPRSIRGVEVAVLFREVKPGVIKVGFRSKGKVNVATLAEAFGGGGHHNAAGCNFQGTVEEVRRIIVKHVEQAL
jgi:phosphoesterase RecJ-like protein